MQSENININGFKPEIDDQLRDLLCMWTEDSAAEAYFAAIDGCERLITHNDFIYTNISLLVPYGHSQIEEQLNPGAIGY